MIEKAAYRTRAHAGWANVISHGWPWRQHTVIDRAASPRVDSWVLLTWAALLLGCSSPENPTYEVRGIVRYTDGQVLTAGSVEFEQLGVKKPVTATGRINPDGTFELGTFAMSDGAVAGQHRVVVIADQNDASRHERPWLVPSIKLHPKYRDFDTSGLQYEVKPEPNQFIIEVEYAPNHPKS